MLRTVPHHGKIRQPFAGTRSRSLSPSNSPFCNIYFFTRQRKWLGFASGLHETSSSRPSLSASRHPPASFPSPTRTLSPLELPPFGFASGLHETSSSRPSLSASRHPPASFRSPICTLSPPRTPPLWIRLRPT